MTPDCLRPGADVSYVRRTGEKTRYQDTLREQHHHVRVVAIHDHDRILVEAIDPIWILPAESCTITGRPVYGLQPGEQAILPAHTLAGPWEDVATDEIARRRTRQRREDALARIAAAGVPTDVTGGELGCAYFDVAAVAALVDERDELLDRLDQAGLLDVTPAPAERPAALAAIDVTPVPVDGLPAGAVAVPVEDLERVARLVGTLRAVSEAH